MVEDHSQWITRDEPRLGIVPQALWDKVKARQENVARTSTRIQAARTGRPAVSLLSGLLVCESCGSRFIAVDRSFYGCASYKQGGLAACTNIARVKRVYVEALLIAEIETEILSDEAIACAQKAIREEFRQYSKRDKAESSEALPKVEKLDAQATTLREFLKAGAISKTVAQAGLDAIERERVELLSAAARREQRQGAEVIRLIPQNAQLYREAVRNLNSTLVAEADRLQARALLAEIFNGPIPVRQEGEAVYARLEMDASVLLAAAAGSQNKINDFQRGSGGRI